MKIFLSVPMHNRTFEDISNDLNTAKDYILNNIRSGLDNNNNIIKDKTDIEFVDNLSCMPAPNYIKNERVWYLGKAIEKLAECDAIFFCYGWRNSTGCLAEEDIANKYGIPVFI